MKTGDNARSTTAETAPLAASPDSPDTETQLNVSGPPAEVTAEGQIAARRRAIADLEGEVARLKTSRGSAGLSKAEKAGAIARTQRLIRDHLNAIERLADLMRQEGAQPGNLNQSGGRRRTEEPGEQAAAEQRPSFSTVTLLAAPDAQQSDFVSMEPPPVEEAEPEHAELPWEVWQAPSRPQQDPAATGDSPELADDPDEDWEEAAEEDETEDEESGPLPGHLDAATRPQPATAPAAMPAHLDEGPPPPPQVRKSTPADTEASFREWRETGRARPRRLVDKPREVHREAPGRPLVDLDAVDAVFAAEQIALGFMDYEGER